MTSKKQLRVQDYVDHILEAITRIELYVKDLNQHSFAENTLVQDAVVRNFEIIGEAPKNTKDTSVDFAQKNPHLRLDQACKMRNALAHGYYSINLGAVWNTIQGDLPILKRHLLDLRQP